MCLVVLPLRHLMKESFYESKENKILMLQTKFLIPEFRKPRIFLND